MLGMYMNKPIKERVTDSLKIATVTFWQQGHLCAVFDYSNNSSVKVNRSFKLLVTKSILILENSSFSYGFRMILQKTELRVSLL